MTPTLLSPAGSLDALSAAICAGADEVYFGGKLFNARVNAKNFGEDEFAEALKLCSFYGVKSNVTLNTILFDRELDDALRFAYNALLHGADSFIVQDLGFASELKRQIPEIKLCASTQCAVHNFCGAKELANIGFSRIVLARELSKSSVSQIVQKAKGAFECEIFAHGALCVCHSGQCLMSSCIGGRSGNRGLCAQPCRMKYSLDADTKNEYPLSLKDLCLAAHIEEILPLGVSTLKIEGRMKSPEYVYNVTKIYKQLLSEKRNATSAELEFLKELFSRDGFTDAYFTGEYEKKNFSMYGVRSDENKTQTRDIEEKTDYALPKIPLRAKFYAKENELPCLALTCGNLCVTAYGERTVETAKSAPANKELCAKNLTKFGDTCFVLDKKDIEFDLDENLFIPASALNALRRDALLLLEKEITQRNIEKICSFEYKKRNWGKKVPKTRIYPEKIDESIIKRYEKCAKSEIECAVFALCEFADLSERKKRILAALPYPFAVTSARVMLGSEREEAKLALECAKKLGAVFFEISNIGALTLAKEVGIPYGAGMMMNVSNSLSCRTLQELGFSFVCALPELTPAQIRDIERRVPCGIFGYGREPLMELESCIKKAAGNCSLCENLSVCEHLKDRTGASFPVICERRFDKKSSCRNRILNSTVHEKRSEENISGADFVCVYGLCE